MNKSKNNKFEPIPIPDVDSMFDPVLSYNSLSKTFRGEIQDGAGCIEFVCEPDESIKRIGKAMQNYANQQIREWEKFKLVVDYLGQKLHVND